MNPVKKHLVERQMDTLSVADIIKYLARRISEGRG